MRGMAYLARQDTFFDESIFHVTWRCHNGTWFLKEDSAKLIYYNLLLKYKDRYGILIYSYSFMSNHPHMTGYAHTREGLSAFMRTVNSQFARNINKLKKRRGQLVMDRFKSPIIQTDDEHIGVMIYEDLNSKRQNMVSHPKEYRWSSYHYYAEGMEDPLITPAPSYLALGDNDEDRRRIYKGMVEAVIAEDALKKREYSRVYYIGNPDWVKARHDEIRAIGRAKREAYLLRQRKMMYGRSPPL